MVQSMDIMFVLFLNNFLITLSFFLYFFIKTNLSNLRSFSSKKDKLLFNPLLKSSNTSGLVCFIKTQLRALLFILIFINFDLTAQNDYFSVTNFKITLIIILFSFFLFIISFINVNNDHWLLGAYLTVLISPFIILSNDLLYTYILIEINAYSFIFLSITQGFTVNRTQRFSIVNSALINFVLNFLSSVLFFITLSTLYYYEGGLSIFFSGNVFFVFFLLLKISLGP